MNIWKLLFGEADTQEHESLPTPDLSINPANGLPMIEGTSIDIEGNPYGMDSSQDIPLFGDGIVDSDWL